MPSEPFLNELRAQFDRMVEAREKLDNKANNFMTMAGTISTILMGVGAFFSNSDEFPDLSYGLLSLFAFGLGLLSISIVLSVFAYKISNQKYPIGSKIFMNGANPTGQVDAYIRSTIPEFERIMIEEYLDGIRIAEDRIDKKGRFIKWSQAFFLAGILMTVSIVIIYLAIFKTIPSTG